MLSQHLPKDTDENEVKHLQNIGSMRRHSNPRHVRRRIRVTARIFRHLFSINNKDKILLRDGVTIDVVWIGNRIYWTIYNNSHQTTSVLSHGLHCAAW
jgi:hypothetical protein